MKDLAILFYNFYNGLPSQHLAFSARTIQTGPINRVHFISQKLYGRSEDKTSLRSGYTEICQIIYELGTSRESKDRKERKKRHKKPGCKGGKIPSRRFERSQSTVWTPDDARA